MILLNKCTYFVKKNCQENYIIFKKIKCATREVKNVTVKYFYALIIMHA